MVGRFFVILIKFYQQAVSPWIGPSCRYTPTCSSYTITCIERFGPFKGSFLGAKRILRCNPFGGYGYDPPPSPKKIKEF